MRVGMKCGRSYRLPRNSDLEEESARIAHIEQPHVTARILAVIKHSLAHVVGIAAVRGREGMQHGAPRIVIMDPPEVERELAEELGRHIDANDRQHALDACRKIARLVIIHALGAVAVLADDLVLAAAREWFRGQDEPDLSLGTGRDGVVLLLRGDWRRGRAV